MRTSLSGGPYKHSEVYIYEAGTLIQKMKRGSSFNDVGHRMYPGCYADMGSRNSNEYPCRRDEIKTDEAGLRWRP